MNALGNGPIPFHFFNSATSSSSTASATSATSATSTSTNSVQPHAISTPSLPSASLTPMHHQGGGGGGVGGYSSVSTPPRRVSPYQKPIRGTFKVAEEGTFRLQREFSLFKSAQKHPSRHFNPSKLIGVLLKRPIFSNNKDRGEREKEGLMEDTEEDVLFFSINSDAGLYCDKYCLRRPYHRFEVRKIVALSFFNFSFLLLNHDLLRFLPSHPLVNLCDRAKIIQFGSMLRL